jgi:hypothetical protein
VLQASSSNLQKCPSGHVEEDVHVCSSSTFRRCFDCDTAEDGLIVTAMSIICKRRKRALNAVRHAMLLFSVRNMYAAAICDEGG